MAGRISHFLSSALLVAAATGCASVPTRFYILDATATSDGGVSASYAISVGPVSIPSSVARPQIVLQSGPNQVELDEFHRWAAPLDEGVARAVAGNLRQLLGTEHVAIAPLANFDPTYRVTIAIQRFDSLRGKGVALEALWIVRGAAAGSTRTGRTEAHEVVTDNSYDALAAAHSRTLATVSRDIAGAIRAEAEVKRK